MTNKSRTNDRNESGEQVARRVDRNRKILFGLLFAVGLGTGIAVGRSAFATGFSGLWSPTLSIGAAILYATAIIAGSIVLSRHSDEVERAQMYKASALAGSALMFAYPIWFLLWKGGILIEPIHWLLFVGFWLLFAGGSLFYRYR